MFAIGKKLLLLVFLLLMLVNITIGGFVSPEMAEKVARNFYFEKASCFQNIKYNNLKINNIEAISDQGELLYYVINFVDKGFILLAADDNVFPVLGYSFESNYLNAEPPPAFSAWLAQYKSQLIYAKQNSFAATSSTTKAWNKYLELDPETTSKQITEKGVAPLLSCNWSQKYLYNNNCPVDPDGIGGHASAGCVAIAMAQLMYYFRYPDMGEGSYGYESDYGYEYADFGNTFYNWNEMVNSIFNMANPAMAELIYHVGVSVEMNYGTNTSSANATDSRDALVNYFKYSDESSFMGAIELGESFNDSLITSLDKQIPLLYRGGDLMMSHAFVCDGYQDSSFFHFNWGWSGQYNGYYNIDTLAPGGYDLTFNQLALFNLYPSENYPTYCSGSDTLKTSRGTFVDGSGLMNYENNSNCQWLISPENQNMTNIQLWFSSFETELNNDYITVYDGPSEEDPILAVFSGSEVPPHITSTGNQMLVVFQSDEANTARGWLAEYLAYSDPFCNPLTTYTDTTMMWITDASGPYYYLDNSDCNWLIAPEISAYDSIASVQLFFHRFDLALDDTLIVYDGDSPNSPVLEKLTGDEIPEQLESSVNKIFLQFKTNETNTADGWAAGYRSTLPVYCQDTVVLTAGSGVIEDGSGEKKYSNNSDCYWLIEPEDAEVITLNFDEFEIEYGYDQLKIYNATEEIPVLMETLWGFYLPEPITLHGNRMLIRFTTDYSQTFEGWKISYTTIEPYVSETLIGQMVELFPNPVKDQLSIQIPSELTGSKYSILTVRGELIEEGIFTNEQNIINTHKLRKGIYCLKIIDDKEFIFKKFIK